MLYERLETRETSSELLARGGEGDGCRGTLERAGNLSHRNKPIGRQVFRHDASGARLIRTHESRELRGRDSGLVEKSKKCRDGMGLREDETQAIRADHAAVMFSRRFGRSMYALPMGRFTWMSRNEAPGVA